MAKILKKKAVERNVLDLAYERLHHAFDLYDTIDVSFSGGKDSTACLNLTLDVARERDRLPLRVFFHDEEAIPYQTEEYVRRVSQNSDIALEWYCLPVKHRNACSRQSPWWSPWDLQEEEQWVRPMPPEGITQLEGFRTDGEPRDRMSIPEINGLLHDPSRYGTCGMVMGIRGQESATRQRSVSYRPEENYLIHYADSSSKGNLWKVYPIYDWQTSDVWTAPKLFNWDYNRAYDVMDQAGISPFMQRCCPAYGEEPLRGFHLFKQCFPELWDRMSTRVPGANAAWLYGRTELYGFGENPEKPDGMSWEAFILHFIGKFPQEERLPVARGIRQCINDHYTRTSDPILSSVPHPESGVAWKYLLNLALRGDFKERRSRTLLLSVIHQTDHEKAWQTYREARKAEGL